MINFVVFELIEKGYGFGVSKEKIFEKEEFKEG